MSDKGRLLVQGVSVGVTSSESRAHVRDGLLAQSPSNGPFGKAPGPHVDPEVAGEFFEEFNQVLKNSSDEVGWLISAIQGTNTVEVGDSGATVPGMGEMVVTTGASSGDGVNVQWHQDVTRACASVGAKLWFAARIIPYQIAASLASLRVGLMTQDTNCLGNAASGVEDGLFFERSTLGVWKAYSRKDYNDTTTTLTSLDLADIGTLVYMTVGFTFDGTTAKFWVDGSLVATHTATVPNNVPLAPVFVILNGEAVAAALIVDWVKVVQLRGV